LSLAAFAVLTAPALAGCLTLHVPPSDPKEPVYSAAVDFDFSRLKSVAALPLEDKVSRETDSVETLNPQVPTIDLMEWPIDRPGDYIQSKLENALVGTRFTVVGRTRLAKTVEELDLQGSDLVDQDTAVEVGKQVGAQAIVFGTVTRCGHQRLVRLDGMGGFIYVNIPDVAFSVNMVDVATGRVVWTCSARDTGRRFLTEKLSVTLGEFVNDISVVEVLGDLERLSAVLAKECVATIPGAALGQSRSAPRGAPGD
jgi:curli biogenesis system outer membrane secretion channel CsgG